jgi:hypothetical protein
MAATLNKDAYLFNHIDYELTANGVSMHNRHYQDLRLCFDNNHLLHYFLRLLPRHAGILYSTSFLMANIGIIEKSRGTLHLYAFPFLLACLVGRAIYVDAPAILFHTPNANADGAWESHSEVFFGLFNFLKTLKEVVSPEIHAIACEGFFANYLGDSSWLRPLLVQCPRGLPSEQHLRDLLFSGL